MWQPRRAARLLGHVAEVVDRHRVDVAADVLRLPAPDRQRTEQLRKPDQQRRSREVRLSTFGVVSRTYARTQNALHLAQEGELVLEMLDHLDRIRQVPRLRSGAQTTVQVDRVAAHSARGSCPGTGRRPRPGRQSLAGTISSARDAPGTFARRRCRARPRGPARCGCSNSSTARIRDGQRKYETGAAPVMGAVCRAGAPSGASPATRAGIPLRRSRDPRRRAEVAQQPVLQAVDQGVAP